MDTQSRSYQVTINNPVEKEFTDDKIDQIIAKSRVTFVNMADEIEHLGRAS